MGVSPPPGPIGPYCLSIAPGKCSHQHTLPKFIPTCAVGLHAKHGAMNGFVMFLILWDLRFVCWIHAHT